MRVATQTTINPFETRRKPWFLIPLFGGLITAFMFIIGLIVMADSTTTEQKTTWILRVLPIVLACIISGFYLLLRYGGKSRLFSFAVVGVIFMVIAIASSNQVADLAFAPLR